MTLLIMAFMLFSAVVAQSLTPPVAALAQSKPPILLGVVVYYAVKHDFGLLVTAAIGAGVLHDSLSLVPLGCSAFWFTLAAVLLHRYRDTIFADSSVTLILLGAGLAAGFTAVSYVTLSSGGDYAVDLPLWRLVLKSLGSALLGMVAVPLVFAVNLRLERLVGLRSEKER